MPPINAPYVPPGFYPPYGPQPGVRHPYAMYPPQMHHQTPPNLYVPPPTQGPYQIPNPHMYQIPPIPYGTVPIVPPMPDLYRMEHPQIIETRQISQEQIKPYGFEPPAMPSRGYQ